MNPSQFYLSSSTELDTLDFQPLVVMQNASPDFNANGQEDNAIVFEGPANLSTGALYRFFDGHLYIASLFGAFIMPLGSLAVGDEVELSNRSPLEHSTWPISLRESWVDALGRPPIQNEMQATRIGEGRFVPIFSAAQMHLSIGGRKEWVVIFLPEHSTSIYQTHSSTVEITTSSGLVFEIPAGREAQLLVAGKVQWALPGDHGSFVLEPLPW